MDHFYTTDKPGEPTCIMVGETLIAKTSSQINESYLEGSSGTRYGDLPVGVIIHTAGYGSMKQKGLDGAWSAI